MRIKLESKGELKNLQSFLTRAAKQDMFSSLDSLGRRGVDALSRATPKDSTGTASAWRYEIKNTKRTCTIGWYNDEKTVDGQPIVILLQYGHGTGTGGWVQGRDFINPAAKPVFDEITDKVWKAVTSA